MFQALDGLVLAAQSGIDNSHKIQRAKLALAILCLARDSQRLLRVLDGFFMLAQGSVGAAHRVKRPNFEIAIPKLTPQDKGLRQDLIRLLCGAALTRFQGPIF